MIEVHARPVYATLNGKREEVVCADRKGRRERERERERERCLRRVESLIRLVTQTVHKTTKATKS